MNMRKGWKEEDAQQEKVTQQEELTTKKLQDAQTQPGEQVKGNVELGFEKDMNLFRTKLCWV